MWWFLAGLFGWAFVWGLTRPDYTVNNYIENNVECEDHYSDSCDYGSDGGGDN